MRGHATCRSSRSRALEVLPQVLRGRAQAFEKLHEVVVFREDDGGFGAGRSEDDGILGVAEAELAKRPCDDAKRGGEPHGDGRDNCASTQTTNARSVIRRPYAARIG